MNLIILAFIGGVGFAILVTLSAQALGRRMAQKEYLP